MKFKNRFFGCFFGAIIGDVLGAPFEFMETDQFKFDGTMSSGGLFNLPKGYYTDDTSMMIAITQSILNTNSVNEIDQLDHYIQWYRNGKYSSTGKCFDIGFQTRQSLVDYEELGELPEETDGQGNGCLMRVAPVILYAISKNLQDFNTDIETSVITTHNNETCKFLTKSYAHFVRDALLNQLDFDCINVSLKNRYENIKDSIDRPDGWIETSYYVALDSFRNTNSFKSCMLDVINKGYDTDTNACIAGMLAGAYYGYDALSEYLDIKDFDILYNYCNDLYDRVLNNFQVKLS